MRGATIGLPQSRPQHLGFSASNKINVKSSDIYCSANIMLTWLQGKVNTTVSK